MSTDTRQPVPYSEAPDYPTYEQAEFCAEDFRTGAEGAFIRDEKWAKYERQPNLVVLVTELQEGIFSIVAYPPAGFEVAYADDIEKRERFRGWILYYSPIAESWQLLVSSQEVGMDEFIRLRREYKAE